MNVKTYDCADCGNPVIISCTKADVAEHARFDEEEVCYDVED